MHSFFKKVTIPIKILKPTIPLQEYQLVIGNVLEELSNKIDSNTADIHTYCSTFYKLFNSTLAAISIMEITSIISESDMTIEILDHGSNNFSILATVNKPIIIH